MRRKVIQSVGLVRQLVMHEDPKTPSFRQVIVHTAMGAVFGALLALALIVTNRHLFELIGPFPITGVPPSTAYGRFFIPDSGRRNSLRINLHDRRNKLTACKTTRQYPA